MQLTNTLFPVLFIVILGNNLSVVSPTFISIATITVESN